MNLTVPKSSGAKTTSSTSTIQGGTTSTTPPVVVDIEKVDQQGNTAFMRASAAGNASEMTRLLKEGADIKKINSAGETALFQTVRSKDIENTRFLLDRGLDLNKKNRAGKNVLQIAIDQKDFPMVTELISRGADPNATNALDQAIRAKESEMVNYLLAIDNIKPESGLIAAAAVNDPALFTRLVEKGARLSNNTPIDEAIKNDNALIVKTALEYGGDANYALEKAIGAEKKGIIMLSLRTGANSKPAWEYAISKGDKTLFNACMDKYQGSPAEALGPTLAANQLEMAESCLLAGGDPHAHIKNVVNSGNKEATQLLLTYGASANQALFVAIKKSNTPIARLAFDNGAKVTSGNYIQTASKLKNAEMVTLLLDNGARADDGLSDAVKVKSDAIVKLLLDRGANPDLGMRQAVTQGSGSIVGLLVSKGADGKDPEYIKIAATAGNELIISHLLKAGANPDDGFKEAIQNSHAKIVKRLIAANADVSDPNFLNISVGKNNTEISKTLLSAGSPITYAHPDGGNLLHAACQHSNTQVASLLLQKGIDVNKANSQGLTPLHIATKQASSLMVQLLVDNKADVNALSMHKDAPLHISTVKNDFGSARILVDQGADVNAVSGTGNYPLHYAVQHKNSVSLAKLLIENGAEINAKNRNNETALKIAKGRKLRKYLKENGGVK